jgi:hypothetical protein
VCRICFACLSGVFGFGTSAFVVNVVNRTRQKAMRSNFMMSAPFEEEFFDRIIGLNKIYMLILKDHVNLVRRLS